MAQQSTSIDESRSSTRPPPRKKKRTLGTFPCQHCDKVFSRSDHLARHNLNHEPKEVFTCEFQLSNGKICSKTFVRKDLKERHYRRHLEMGDGHSSRQNSETDEEGMMTISTMGTSGMASSSSDSIGRTIRRDSEFTGDEKPSTVEEVNDLQYPSHRAKMDPNLIQIIPPQPQPQPRQPPAMMGPLSHPPPMHSATSSLHSTPHIIEPSPIGSMSSVPPQPQIPEMPQQHVPPQQTYPNQPINHLFPAQPTASHQRQPTPLSQFQMYPVQEQSPFNQSQNLNDLYKAYGAPTGQTQNDILSWLFTDSPPNPTKSEKSDSGFQQPPPPQPVLPQTVQPAPAASPRLPPPPSQQFLGRTPGMLPPTPLGFPTPYTESQFMQTQLSNPSNFPVDPGFNNNSISGNYGFQDVNIFQNDDNPLDEIFLRAALPSDPRGNLMPPGQQQSGQDSGGGNNNNLARAQYASYLSLNTASSTSPTNTNESNTSPYYCPDVENGLDPFEAKLIHHAEKCNLEKNPHYFIDCLLLDSILKCLGGSISREMISEIFKPETDRYTIEDRLSYYISIYWTIFHPQFMILHRPSFDTKDCDPLLVISMILIGSVYSCPDIAESLGQTHQKSPEFKFTLLISKPLRFAIFQHDEFKSPVQVWILQSLAMLEWIEKNFLNRRMHERGHVHHGTMVQLLRRSPALGGNPAVMKGGRNGGRSNAGSGSNTSAGEEDMEGVVEVVDPKEMEKNSDAELFWKWRDSESMKRITFMIFYVDIIDYVKFRHNPAIMFYQLQLLNLPCDDEYLWESKEINGSFKKLVKRQKKLQSDLKKLNSQSNTSIKIRNGESFLNVLKKLLKPYKDSDFKIQSKLSIFTRKILLAGLVSILYQMQQTDLQNSSSLLTSNGIITTNKSKVWKEILIKAFDNWNYSIMQYYYSNHSNLSNSKISIYNDLHNLEVPLPMYYLVQIIGLSDINHYDIAIFGGSPANQSVRATMKDHYIVQRKLSNIWGGNISHHKNKNINELTNLRSVVHCYLLLWQLMLSPVDPDDHDGLSVNQGGFLNWNSNADYYDCMYAISIATLVLWCYCFTKCGRESERFGEIEKETEEDDEDVMYSTQVRLNQKQYSELRQYCAEDGYQYLNRVRQEFLTNLRKFNLHKQFNLHSLKSSDENTKISANEMLAKYCDLLPQISNKQNISGLCFLIGTKLMTSQWEIIRENAKLILNCGFRSIGKKNILCLDLFDNEFND
ncbi:uncharacterized protein J8A68_004655 [[Candida] subhashii]|uniref:C2H2-type domain-containing protein n=1 Tax=[Candida] subhashii TaxID=561895 RepID=A0A8J5Q5H8_9ASCO|nr:uncharacterized protein J8A68_004655 [[Candida] subhashii]KAG7661829.1 hypothetical protein J8A68_004655 [[Candida] subhashii]